MPEADEVHEALEALSRLSAHHEGLVERFARLRMEIRRRPALGLALAAELADAADRVVAEFATDD